MREDTPPHEPNTDDLLDHDESKSFIDVVFLFYLYCNHFSSDLHW